MYFHIMYVHRSIRELILCGLWVVQTTLLRPQVAGQANLGSEAEIVDIAEVRGELITNH